jgi:cell division protein FtsZ
MPLPHQPSFLLDQDNTFKARIKVVGIGGGGGNVLNTMISCGIDGVDFIAANTDAQSLRVNLAPTKVQLGVGLTRGLGAGADPEVGRQAAVENEGAIADALAGADMVFVTAGMGGGTGTGASAVVARIAKQVGALTVGVVTKPFGFEGKRRMNQAKQGIECLREEVDALIIIPNERLLSIAGNDATVMTAFRMVDDVLVQAVRGISDLINTTGYVNADFADVRRVMSEKGMALMGAGIREGENRAVLAAQDAISSPLLDNVSIEGARGVLINICGPSSMTLSEVNDAASLIQEAAHEDANIIFGQVIDDRMGNAVQVTVIATAFGDSQGETQSLDVVRMPERPVRQQPPAPKTVDRDIPTFIRKEQDKTQAVRVTRVSGSDVELEDEYDIPTFLRKQAD